LKVGHSEFFDGRKHMVFFRKMIILIFYGCQKKADLQAAILYEI